MASANKLFYRFSHSRLYFSDSFLVFAWNEEWSQFSSSSHKFATGAVHHINYEHVSLTSNNQKVSKY